MAKLDLTPEQFADYIVALMLDKIINMDDVISENKEFTELMEDFKGIGAKSKLMKVYLNMPSEIRMKYKWTRETLTGESNVIHVIRIIPVEDKKEKEGLIKKALNKIKSSILGDSVKFTKEESDIIKEIIGEGEEDGRISG